MKSVLREPSLGKVRVPQADDTLANDAIPNWLRSKSNSCQDFKLLMSSLKEHHFKFDLWLQSGQPGSLIPCRAFTPDIVCKISCLVV